MPTPLAKAALQVDVVHLPPMTVQVYDVPEVVPLRIAWFPKSEIYRAPVPSAAIPDGALKPPVPVLE